MQIAKLKLKLKERNFGRRQPQILVSHIFNDLSPPNLEFHRISSLGTIDSSDEYNNTETDDDEGASELLVEDPRLTESAGQHTLIENFHWGNSTNYNG